MEHDYLKYRPLQINDKIIVIGACIGDFMKEYKNEIISKNIKVINIEPNMDLCTHLMRWTIDNLPNNSIVLNIAITGKTKLCEFKNRENFLISNIGKSDFDFINYKPSLVLSLSLKSLFDILGWVDAILCDIEGSEIDVFQFDPRCYCAIAAYHIMNGEPTYKKLSAIFKNPIIENPNKWSETMLYAK